MVETAVGVAGSDGEAGQKTVRDLTFLKDGKWAPDRCGIYEEDNRRGRVHAEEMLDLIRDSENPNIYGAVARAMTEAGQYGATEIGFCSHIGIFLMINTR